MSEAIEAGAEAQPQLPTYRSVAAFLERKTSSGLKLFGWTAARMILIAPPLLLVSYARPFRDMDPWKKVLIGTGIASVLISSLAVFRVARTEEGMAKAYFNPKTNKKWQGKVIKPPRGMKQIG